MLGLCPLSNEGDRLSPYLETANMDLVQDRHRGLTATSRQQNRHANQAVQVRDGFATFSLRVEKLRNREK